MPKPEANEAVQASAEEQKAARRAARRASKGTQPGIKIEHASSLPNIKKQKTLR